MSVDILGTIWDQCRSMVQYSFTSMETRRLVRTDSPGRPPRLSHSSWTMTTTARKYRRIYIYKHNVKPHWWCAVRNQSASWREMWVEKETGIQRVYPELFGGRWRQTYVLHRPSTFSSSTVIALLNHTALHLPRASRQPLSPFQMLFLVVMRLFLVVMRLRLDLPVQHIALFFGMHRTAAADYFMDTVCEAQTRCFNNRLFWSIYWRPGHRPFWIMNTTPYYYLIGILRINSIGASFFHFERVWGGPGIALVLLLLFFDSWFKQKNKNRDEINIQKIIMCSSTSYSI